MGNLLFRDPERGPEPPAKLRAQQVGRLRTREFCVNPSEGSAPVGRLPAGVVRLAVVSLLLVGAGCNTRDVGSAVGYIPGLDASTDGPRMDAWVLPDGPVTTDGGMAVDACVPVTCDRIGLEYCGTIGDGCGAVLECGDCSNGQPCGGHGSANICPPLPGSCTATNCTPPGGAGKYCGKIGDSCGGTIECGDCPAGETCGGAGIDGLCAVPPPSSCQRLQCNQPGGRLCGRVGDNCGGAIECGDCATGQTCGAAGIPGVCGVPPSACTRLDCSPAGGKFCGRIGDGCGGLLECGDCTGSDTCGGAGTQSVCGPPPGSCTAMTCNVVGGPLCGTVGDGCGGTLPCGDCPAGQTCGAVRPGVCAPLRVLRGDHLRLHGRTLLRHHRQWLRRRPQLRRHLPRRADLRRRRCHRGVRQRHRRRTLRRPGMPAPGLRRHAQDHPEWHGLRSGGPGAALRRDRLHQQRAGGPRSPRAPAARSAPTPSRANRSPPR